MKRYTIGRNGLPEFSDTGEYVAYSDVKRLEEKEALGKAPPGWAEMDPTFVIEHIRHATVFDASMIEAMLDFAINAAIAAHRSGGAPDLLTNQIDTGASQ